MVFGLILPREHIVRDNLQLGVVSDVLRMRMGSEVGS